MPARSGHASVRAAPGVGPRRDTVLALLLANQGIVLGSPAGVAESTASLPYYRLFRPGAALFNSVELHADGTVYASDIPPLTPEWYATGRADDAEDTRDRLIRTARRMRRFSDVQAMNAADTTWVPPERAFPPGRAPAPRWVTMRLQTDVLTPAPRATTPLGNSGDYCSRDIVSKLDPLLGIFDPNVGPPEWTTILPRNWALPAQGDGGRERDNGQRKYHPTLPLGWPGNHYVTWDEVVHLAQTDTARLRTVLRWRERPTHRDVRDRPIPWIAATVTGVVTNSFLSGADYAGDHTEPPADYWLGRSPPPDSEPCGLFNAEHSLCDDWIVRVRPDPEYRFLLAQDREREAGTDKGLGNFTAELGGSLEAEIEQWLIPVGFRPEPADRISMTGRWVVDCGHDDWHSELHPIESLVATHAEGSAVVASVVITGDWPGGELELDVWPPARPSAAAMLRWRRHGRTALAGLTVDERAEPADNPNHLHLTVVSTAPWQPLVTEDWNQVLPHPTRRLATQYQVWWSAR